ncbi:hypothetical protein PENSPDRAFT_755895 [Peniophora sp. CONT]|nr:hypothetical protein PENSPDRAFT_755895 [Peniophora sp. CONT]
MLLPRTTHIRVPYSTLLSALSRGAVYPSFIVSDALKPLHRYTYISHTVLHSISLIRLSSNSSTLLSTLRLPSSLLPNLWLPCPTSPPFCCSRL